MESFDLNKLIFGDLLDAEELGKLVNIDLGIGGIKNLLKYQTNQ